MRKTFVRALQVALLLGGVTVCGMAPAHADDWGISVGIGAPGWDGYYDDGRPCWWYRSYDLPAPRRCYSYFYGLWGSSIYTDGDFIFRDRDDWWRWHDRADYRHWREHDFQWRDHQGGGARATWHEAPRHDWSGDRATWSGGQQGRNRDNWHNANRGDAGHRGVVNWGGDHSRGWNGDRSNWSGHNGGNWHGDRQDHVGGSRGNWGHGNHGGGHDGGNRHR